MPFSRWVYVYEDCENCNKTGVVYERDTGSTNNVPVQQACSFCKGRGKIETKFRIWTERD